MGPSLHQAFTFESFQGIRTEIAEQFDSDLSSQKVLVAALFFSELAVVAGSLAGIVLALSLWPPG